MNKEIQAEVHEMISNMFKNVKNEADKDELIKAAYKLLDIPY